MHQCRPTRFWNHLVLCTLVLLVAGSAVCTVAASAATGSHDAMASSTAIGP
jgi:hypothetical protein